MLVRHVLVTASVCACLGAAEEPAAEASPWSHEATLSVGINTVSAVHAEDSRDPTIASTTDTFAWRGAFSGKLLYAVERHRLRQQIDLSYGRQEEEGEATSETIDEIIYDNQYDRVLGDPHLLFLAWGADSVFTGPEPDEEPLDPVLGKVSTGYGQEYRNLLPQQDRLAWRVGVRAQKRWGRGLGDEGREVEIGLEGRVRYERTQNDQLSYFGQYEIFSEFEDPGHTTHLGTAGLTLQLTEMLGLEFAVRAYYETTPDDAADDAPGYDSLSWRQETVLSVLYTF